MKQRYFFFFFPQPHRAESVRSVTDTERGEEEEEEEEGRRMGLRERGEQEDKACDSVGSHITRKQGWSGHNPHVLCS